MWFNHKHYPDPTACMAMENVICGSRDRTDEEGLHLLAEAVIVTAARDYLDLLGCPYRSERLLREKRELEEFFLSSRFRRLSGLNGKIILQRLREEMKRT